MLYLQIREFTMYLEKRQIKRYQRTLWFKQRENYLAIISTSLMILLFTPLIAITAPANHAAKQIKTTYTKLQNKKYLTITELDKNKHKLYFSNCYSTINGLNHFNNHIVVDNSNGHEYYIDVVNKSKQKYDLVPNLTKNGSYVINSAWQKDHMSKFN